MPSRFRMRSSLLLALQTFLAHLAPQREVRSVRVYFDELGLARKTMTHNTASLSISLLTSDMLRLRFDLM